MKKADVRLFIKKIFTFLPVKGERHYRWSIFIWSSALCIAIFFFVGFTWLAHFKTPSFEELENPDYALASFIFDDKSEIIGKYFVENREQLTYDSINPLLIKTLLAVEDERFFDHTGVDYKALGRVVVRTLIMREKNSGGGSTLTQQLAKLLFKRPEIKDVSS